LRAPDSHEVTKFQRIETSERVHACATLGSRYGFGGERRLVEAFDEFRTSLADAAKTYSTHSDLRSSAFIRVRSGLNYNDL